MKKTLMSVALAALVTSTSAVANTDTEIAELKQQIAELKETTSTLVDETSDLKTGFNYTKVDDAKAFSGLGAAASKVYYSQSPLSIGGYGEMYYQAQSSGASKAVTYRFVPYIGYKFSDSIILNTEIEFEHGGSQVTSISQDDTTKDISVSQKGEYAKVEFMYLDFLLNKHANVRVGNFLVPMGLVNQRHEPTLFTTVQRPETEKYLIPSTWNESGAMVFGSIIDGLEYKVAMITALKTGTDGSKWIRNGRGGSWDNKNPNAGFVARLDYTGHNGLLVGASAYTGASNDNDGSDSNLVMWDVHLDYKVKGFRAYGLYTASSRSNADKISADAVEAAKGGYLNLSYDAFAMLSTSQKLPVFVQLEKYNTQAKLADGSENDAKNNTSFGVNYFPHDQVVLKADYKMTKVDHSDRTDYTSSVSMGFIF